MFVLINQDDSLSFSISMDYRYLVNRTYYNLDNLFRVHDMEDNTTECLSELINNGISFLQFAGTLNDVLDIVSVFFTHNLECALGLSRFLYNDKNEAKFLRLSVECSVDVNSLNQRTTLELGDFSLFAYQKKAGFLHLLTSTSEFSIQCKRFFQNSSDYRYFEINREKFEVSLLDYRDFDSTQQNSCIDVVNIRRQGESIYGVFIMNLCCYVPFKIVLKNNDLYSIQCMCSDDKVVKAVPVGPTILQQIIFNSR